MALYKRGKIWWIRVDPITKGRLSTRCADKTAARLFEKERERFAADPRHAAANAATVRDWIVRTIAYKTAAGKAAGTLEMYRVKLGHVARIIGEDTPLAYITPAEIDRYIAQRQAEGAVNNTIQRELSCLMQLVKLARRAGEYAGDVAALMPVGFAAGYVPGERVLSLDEWSKLRVVLSVGELAWCAFALATAGRLGEVERALPEDYDRDTRVLLVRGTKTGAARRRIPILPVFRELFESALPHLPLRWPNVSKRLPERCKLAGIPPVTPNDLRRTHATWLLELGADESDVSRQLGHTTTALVRRTYGKLSAAGLGRRLAERTGTKESQNSPKSQGPLAKTGRRGGFKKQRGLGSSSVSARFARLNSAVTRRISAALGTRTSRIPGLVRVALFTRIRRVA